MSIDCSSRFMVFHIPQDNRAIPTCCCDCFSIGTKRSTYNIVSMIHQSVLVVTINIPQNHRVISTATCDCFPISTKSNAQTVSTCPTRVSLSVLVVTSQRRTNGKSLQPSQLAIVFPSGLYAICLICSKPSVVKVAFNLPVVKSHNLIVSLSLLLSRPLVAIVFPSGLIAKLSTKPFCAIKLILAHLTRHPKVLPFHHANLLLRLFSHLD